MNLTMPKVEKLAIKKPDLTKIKELANKPMSKQILPSVFKGAQIWLTLFIIAQILISGGKSERNFYYIIVMVILSIAFQLWLISKTRYSSIKPTLISAFAVLITFAILDYLIINLWLHKNNYALYLYWPYYFIYLSLIALPLLRSNLVKIKFPNLKSLLTKKKHSL